MPAPVPNVTTAAELLCEAIDESVTNPNLHLMQVCIYIYILYVARHLNLPFSLTQADTSATIALNMRQ
jgi:hypothetical protein